MWKVLRGLFVMLVVVAAGAVNTPQAHAQDSAPVNWWNVKVNLSSDGVAHVDATLEMDFSKVKGRGPVFALPKRQRTGNENQWYRFEISGVQVSSPSGAHSDTQITQDNGTMTVRVGEANTVYSTPQTYRISYDITGLIATKHPESGLDEFNWNVIGNWASEIKNFQVSITGPAEISKVSCWQTTNLDKPCESSSGGTSASYSVDRIPAGDPVQVVAGFPAGTFPGVTQTIETIDQERRRTPWPIFWSLWSEHSPLNPVFGTATAVLSVGAVVALVMIRNKKARDEVFLGLTPGLAPAAGMAARTGKRRGKVNVAVAFQPPRGARPGEIGTLVDATADSVDISATIIDLAVRGYLVITATEHGGHLLTRTDKNSDGLIGYELKLLNRIFRPKSGHTTPKRKTHQPNTERKNHPSEIPQKGSQVSLKDLRDEKYGDIQSTARQGLYNRVVALGWFRSNPQAGRQSALKKGISIALFGTIVSFQLGVAFGWGIVGIPIMLFGAGLAIMSQRFGVRTAQGSAALEQARGFELYLRTAEKEQLRFEEGVDIFSRYLPYAMIFGVTHRWTKLFAQLGAEGRNLANTSWYQGADLYHSTGSFYTSLGSFSQDFSYSMAQAAAATAWSASSGSSGGSGFSGGSFSGGSGFSGGGGSSGGGFSGGSW